mgnify:CR=1 FL=1
MGSRVLQPIEMPLTVEGVVETLGSRLYGIEFSNARLDGIYPTNITIGSDLTLVAEMSDDTVFKITVEEV